MRNRMALGTALLAGMGAFVLSAQQRPAASVFTADQASSGQSSYKEHCSTCHGPELAGRNEAPQLAGDNFMNAWGGRPIRDLITLIQTTMPPEQEGSVSAKMATEIVAYILTQNGAAAGEQSLAADAGNPIRSVATGRPPARTADAGPAGGGRGARGGRGGRGGNGANGGRGGRIGQGVFPVNLAPARGQTVEGEVKNYVPVSDEMLRDPAPGDWLMVRGNYQAWSYSKLTQITPANVKNLRLVWERAMNESGANEPSPLFHSNTIFLANTSNYIQALDARTGDLIWENQIGPTVGSGGTIAMRNVALYHDKLYAATTDGRVVALSAATGKVVWDTSVSEKVGEFTHTSGPIVINGKVIQGLTGCILYENAAG